MKLSLTSWEIAAYRPALWGLSISPLCGSLASWFQMTTCLIAPFWGVRDKTFLSFLSLTRWEEETDSVYFFPDSLMLLLKWKPLHEATSGQTNIYSSGKIKQTNTGGEENIWVLNTHLGVLWSWTWKRVILSLELRTWEPQQCASNWLPLKLIAPIYFQKLEIYWCYYLYFQT